MIGIIALMLYSSFVLGFTAYYIFVGYSEWNCIQKIFATVVATLIYAIILPAMCGVCIGIHLVNKLEKE